MAAHPDILDEREPWRNPLLGSVLFHVVVFGLLALSGWIEAGSTERWGDPLSLGGGAVAITPVDRIEITPKEGKVNPVANPTESVVPAEPVKPEPPRPPEPEPEAVPLKSKTAPPKAKPKPKPKPVSPQKYTPEREPKPNQTYSSTGSAAISPLYSQSQGGGGVGSGSTSPFGNRFGWYEQLIREKVARNWRSQDLDARIQTPAVVVFDIQRDGSVRDVRVGRTSGNFAMDQSAQRAILQSSPFPPLPPQYERSSATIEFWFRLQK
ncbi:MAG: energy transducer TonB [Bryobacteraceae bacterium]